MPAASGPLVEKTVLIGGEGAPSHTRKECLRIASLNTDGTGVVEKS